MKICFGFRNSAIRSSFGLRISAFGFGLLTLSLAAANIPTNPSPAQCLYLPPAWAERVVFYHSFESGFDQPEINRLQARLPKGPARLVPGFAGAGCLLPLGPNLKNTFELASPGFSVHRPLTVMCWFRVEAPMAETTSFNLVTLRGNGPHIPHFVAGKGPWCGLTEPTFIHQVVGFPGIPQYHNQWTGRAWFETNDWHHAALTVANASEIRFYRDGLLCDTVLPKGRPFKEGEISSASFGSEGHPMVLDEILVVDRALTPVEMADYVLAARSLRDRGFPALQKLNLKR